MPSREGEDRGRRSRSSVMRECAEWWSLACFGGKLNSPRERSHNFSLSKVQFNCLVSRVCGSKLPAHRRPDRDGRDDDLPLLGSHRPADRRLSTASMMPHGSPVPITSFTRPPSRGCTAATGPRPRPVRGRAQISTADGSSSTRSSCGRNQVL